ncbi:Suppressor of fused protein (SUFU) [Hahella sp. KA22]|uniref:suppressor of fused domain protein n=1 Tax=Hahella sp. KA22 TaxID=1628392 RepID=UPI000FDEDA1A|nr:suppressor of fused domain protein [Hahella sp. KA22]AZZ91916.1 Suppressor of fused protein (SUFU) [Hahella sp. KA22]QAY55287.1 Suppressor of fused protein (SUFU) [Hahella sp. KA22]
MKSLFNKLAGLFSNRASESGQGSAPITQNESPQEQFWQKVYDERSEYYETHFGALPSEILKIGHMFGVWPGGGLYMIPANKLGEGMWVYTTFGFTNPDMPSGVAANNVDVEKDEQGRVISSAAMLTRKNVAAHNEGVPGYGYEMLMIAREKAEWPLWFLQWTANAEILNDAGILERVSKHDGLTVEEIQAGESEFINVLIAKAQPPLPSTGKLSNGNMEILIATVITDEEMRWSMEHGRPALLQRLMKAGVGQVSDRHRASVV